MSIYENMDYFQIMLFTVTCWKFQKIQQPYIKRYFYVSFSTNTVEILLKLRADASSGPGAVKAFLQGSSSPSPSPSPSSSRRRVTQSFDVFFDLRLNKRLSKQSWGWWFETPSRPLWRHCNDESQLWSGKAELWLTKTSLELKGSKISDISSAFSMGMPWTELF